jgi:hypothetical protein
MLGLIGLLLFPALALASGPIFERVLELPATDLAEAYLADALPLFLEIARQSSSSHNWEVVGGIQIRLRRWADALVSHVRALLLHPTGANAHKNIRAILQSAPDGFSPWLDNLYLRDAIPPIYPPGFVRWMGKGHPNPWKCN